MRKSWPTSMPALPGSKPTVATRRAWASPASAGAAVSFGYTAAHNPKVKAAAAWYGRLNGETNERTPTQPLAIAATLKTPVLGLYAGQDQGIPQTDVEKMRTALKQAGNASEILVYPDAQHAFHADYRPSYNKAAAEDGWQRMLVWFKKYGV